MTVHVYAALKDYFESEFEVASPVQNTDDLKSRMLALNGQAAALLDSCRFAVADGFIDNVYNLTNHENVVVIPPSSGG